MEIETAKNIHEKIVSYNLLDDLIKAMELRRKGGVKRGVIYKAFRFGGITKVTKLILETGAELIAEHERAFEPEAEAA